MGGEETPSLKAFLISILAGMIFLFGSIVFYHRSPLPKTAKILIIIGAVILILTVLFVIIYLKLANEDENAQINSNNTGNLDNNLESAPPFFLKIAGVEIPLGVVLESLGVEERIKIPLFLESAIDKNPTRTEGLQCARKTHEEKRRIILEKITSGEWPNPCGVQGSGKSTYFPKSAPDTDAVCHGTSKNMLGNTDITPVQKTLESPS